MVDVYGESYRIARRYMTRLDTKDFEESERLARCFLESINRPYRMDGETLKLGTSMGIAVLPEDGADVDTLMKSAESAIGRSRRARIMV